MYEIQRCVACSYVLLAAIGLLGVHKARCSIVTAVDGGVMPRRSQLGFDSSSSSSSSGFKGGSRYIPSLQDLVPLESWSQRVNYRFSASKQMLQQAHMNGAADMRLQRLAAKLLQGKQVKVGASESMAFMADFSANWPSL